MKILVIDDSIVARTVIRLALDGLDNIESVETASSPLIAFQKINQKEYDFIISDINMPEESGLEFMKRLKDNKIEIPTVFFSSMSKDLIQDAVDIMVLGTCDIIPKPENMSREQVLDYIKEKMTPYINHIGSDRKNVSLSPTRKKVSQIKSDIHCLVIGGSTGGPPALEKMLVNLGQVRVPILVAIHMPDQFTEGFAERLNKLCAFEVRLAKEGEEIVPGICYISRGGMSLMIHKKEGKVIMGYEQVPGPGEIYPSVDHLISSVSKVYKSNTLGVVITGMGNDGLNGARELKSYDGHLVIQDKDSSAVFGMPGAIWDAGLTQEALDINEISNYINRVYLKKTMSGVSNG